MAGTRLQSTALAYSYVQYPGNGTARLFSVPFPFIVRAHVKVYLSYNIVTGVGTELVDGTSFTWLSDTQIQATVAPVQGTTITIVRKTPLTTQLVVWAAGSPPTSAELNTADLQTLYVVQELLDNVKNAEYATTAGTATYAISAGFAKPDNQEPNVFYVRSEGSNAKDGRNAHNGFQHIEHALELIESFS
jgi:hypothetical protein